VVTPSPFELVASGGKERVLAERSRRKDEKYVWNKREYFA